MVFCFVQKFFIGQHKSWNIFILPREAGIFFPNLTLGYMTKTLNQIIFFFLHQNQNIFFSNIGNQNIFLEKNHTPPLPFKLNGRSLSGAFYYRLNVCTGLCKLLFETQFLSNYPTIIILYLYSNILQVNNKCIISCNHLTKLLK
jgi:hypothetical protein